MMTTGSKEIPSGVKALRWSAALLLIGGLLFGALSGSLGIAALAFGFGAMLLGLGQLLTGEDRGGRLIGIVLVAGGAFAILDTVIWILSGAGSWW